MVKSGLTVRDGVKVKLFRCVSLICMCVCVCVCAVKFLVNKVSGQWLIKSSFQKNSESDKLHRRFLTLH